MPSGGKEGKWRAELAREQKAYRAIAAKEERQRNRISKRDMAMDAAMRALEEAKALILRMELSGELAEASKGKLDPVTGVVSLINRAVREIKSARDS